MRTFRDTIALLLCSACILHAAPDAEVRVRETSYYAGIPFNFYVHVTGLQDAPEPLLFENEDLAVRYIGKAPATRSGEVALTFTYEAVPLRGGKILIPGGLLSTGAEELEFPGKEVTVEFPQVSEDMELKVEASMEECFVGQPIILTFTWTTELSLNGIKAVNLRVPAMADRHFKVRDLRNAAAINSSNAIGLPVSGQRVTAEYLEVERNENPAMQLKFQKILVPQESGNLTLDATTLLCSYARPRETEFKGTRYPPYFDNDFFQQDVVGEYERLIVSSEPMQIRIKELPLEGKPDNFSGIVGNLKLEADATPQILEVNQPVTYKLEATGVPFVHLLELPPLSEQSAFLHGFDVPEERTIPEFTERSAIFVQSIRPNRQTVSSIPAVEISYFNPYTKTYGLAKTEPISLTVTRSESTSAFDAQFADGSRIQNEVRSQKGGIYENMLGANLDLVHSTHPLGNFRHLLWVFLAGPLLILLAIWFFSRDYRRSRIHPDEVRRKRAFRDFRRRINRLSSNAEPAALSAELRSYLTQRFDLAASASSVEEVRTLSSQARLKPEDQTVLAEIVDLTDANEFSRHEVTSPDLTPSRLTSLVRQLDKVVLVLLVVVLSGSLQAQEEAHQTLFDQANEAALVSPAEANALYLRSARLLEEKVEQGAQNGPLFYNLGNTFFLAGDVGKAILNYRRAELYLPLNAKLQDALTYVRTQRVDVFPDRGPGTIRKFTFFWHYFGSQAIRVWVFTGCWLAICVWAGFHIFRPVSLIVPIAAGVVLCAVGISLWIHSTEDPMKEAVIVEAEVVPRKGDAFVYDAAFTNALHSGLEVKIREQRRDWLRIELESGESGWVPESTVAIVGDF